MRRSCRGDEGLAEPLANRGIGREFGQWPPSGVLVVEPRLVAAPARCSPGRRPRVAASRFPGQPRARYQAPAFTVDQPFVPGMACLTYISEGASSGSRAAGASRGRRWRLGSAKQSIDGAPRVLDDVLFRGVCRHDHRRPLVRRPDERAPAAARSVRWRDHDLITAIPDSSCGHGSASEWRSQL